MLRAVADLLDSVPEAPLPAVRIGFSVSGGEVPARMAAITAALPGDWSAVLKRSDPHAWLYLENPPGCYPGSGPGVTVLVSASAEDACAEAGTRTVTTWKPVPEVAALITDGSGEFDA